MKLYMIRHGESVANSCGLHAGWFDTPLSNKGETQALRVGEIIKKYSFDKVYCSDLLRAIQTKEIALPNTEVVLSDKLREINVGNLSGKSKDECKREYGERYLVDKAENNFTFYGGENRETHEKRVSEFLNIVKHEKYENVAVFCHAGTIRCVMRISCFDKADEIKISNGDLYIFEYSNGVWKYISE